MSRGIVFDIQRFAVHDGPGLRTSVFLKGCALRCPWCQNPEGLEVYIGLWYFEKKCIRCLHCLPVCPEGALSQQSGQRGSIVVDRQRCTRCGRCVEVCPTRALVFDGKEMEADEVLETVQRDRIFYEVSGGGVTVTGGDPLIQHAFAQEILETSRREGVNTAVETCLCAERSVVDSLSEAVDLWIVDVKLQDPELHRRYTGVDNRTIISNLKMLAERGRPVLVRIPLIPGITEQVDNLRRIARLVKELNAGLPVELINYNPLAEDKYRLMGRPYPAGSHFDPFSEAQMSAFRELMRAEGARVIEES